LIYEYSGVTGVNPDSFSLAELSTMQRGKAKHNWDLFAPLICSVINQYASKKNRVKISDIHPFKNKKKDAKVIPFDRTIWKGIIANYKKKNRRDAMHCVSTRDIRDKRDKDHIS
jgi:hypothetical protein